MKNIFKFSVLYVLFLLTLQSCTKSKAEQMNEFVNIYNTSIASSNLNNFSTTTSAEISGENEITIELISKRNNDIENQLLSSSMPDVLEVALEQEPICKDLIATGVQFKIEVIDNNGKIVNSKKLNLSNKTSTSDSLSKNSKEEQLQKMLNAFNKNLPQTDKETGIKILKIKVGKDNDVIYVGEVPDDLIPVFKIKETIMLVKDEILKNQQIKNVLQSGAVYGINKVKYQYNDAKGNNLAEILVTKKDLK